MEKITEQIKTYCFGDMYIINKEKGGLYYVDEYPQINDFDFQITKEKLKNFLAKSFED